MLVHYCKPHNASGQHASGGAAASERKWGGASEAEYEREHVPVANPANQSNKSLISTDSDVDEGGNASPIDRDLGDEFTLSPEANMSVAQNISSRFTDPDSDNHS